MFDLKKKIALVTGASRGLGWAMAQSLASAGAHVVLNARDGIALATRTAELQSQGLSGEAAAFDVNDSAAAEACVADIVARHGRLDILIANAGINHRSPIGAFERDDFERVIGTNLTSVWVLCKAAAKSMAPRRAGRSAYVASKGAVHALTRQLAVELAPDQITVNCIAPGFFATEMNTPLLADAAFNDWVCKRTPAGRWGSLQEIGPAAVFLASDEASYVTGLVMPVDGGFTAAM
ncbi:SDR family oxidoreductase [Variovorax sp. J22R133]|uniref:SDR family NAD(P)-dependent oxidoreductase n=1 Tax=Variovorax brevis TaxID=3053503 RepID=UPI00257657F2|nr:SDR family oxidoreductase [Variovorax sp. J22R133]MDM0117306.1 SDR family oxidoreductase [Variovorax sp. J22R133]